MLPYCVTYFSFFWELHFLLLFWSLEAARCIQTEYFLFSNMIWNCLWWNVMCNFVFERWWFLLLFSQSFSLFFLSLMSFLISIRISLYAVHLSKGMGTLGPLMPTLLLPCVTQSVDWMYVMKNWFAPRANFQLANITYFIFWTRVVCGTMDPAILVFFVLITDGKWSYTLFVSYAEDTC